MIRTAFLFSALVFAPLTIPVAYAATPAPAAKPDAASPDRAAFMAAQAAWRRGLAAPIDEHAARAS